ncbi:phosphoglucomutase [Marinithermofilum abyssi]|uniref:Phosphoglucomutase n=1 Tax=Marinithermofilum abyssi TaxID=1571185 RepID=A0A8J2VFE0_9BACL|nr:phospho-sugar mutase [Marinithermofilum abyssi]GGE17000.1 phosphoglucomutase [Marinithermofilum abyssi]
MNASYQRWQLYSNLDPELKEELASYNKTDIEDAFYRHLAFGTAGMRGLIGPGTNRINRYTVRRTTTGLARFLSAQGEKTKNQGVVIAYDSRRMSPEFAEEAACVLAYYGVPVYLFPSLRPTPILSFAVRHLNTAAGIMITASHNPPEYNGYKLYGEDGAQMPPYKVEHIIREIEQIENELTLPTMSKEEGIRTGLIRILGDEVDRAYIEKVKSLSLEQQKNPSPDPLRIVFTPLHGTGNLPIRQVLEELGYTHLYIVPEQEQPDPDFPTVSSPNPEERQAFDLALTQAKEQKADIVLGTDPDADRLGLFAKNAAGEYTAFNGNQIGVLLLHYLLERRKEKGKLPENGVVLKSLVTSEMGTVIAREHGVTMVDVLTGFKYIAEKIEEYRNTGRHTFLFGYEESYGYLFGDFVRDKDAVQAAMMCCDMAAYYKQQGRTLDQVLEQLFEKHGVYAEDLFSMTFKGKAGQEKMDRIMTEWRTTPLKTIGGIPVRELKDYAKRIDGLPQADVLKYLLEDGCWIAVRPSGTEPKIKFYFSVVAKTREDAEDKMNRIQADVRDLVERS